MLLAGEFLKLITAINELSGLMKARTKKQKLIAGDLWDIDVLTAYYCFDNLGWSPVNTMPCRSVKRLWSGHLLCVQWKSA